jgi:phospholipid-binding lipoprotein MlaA
VIPLLGPSTVRDMSAWSVNAYGNPLKVFPDAGTRDRLAGLNLVDTRANLLRATETLEEAALDKYSFTRDFYLQVRDNDVYDGNPPDIDK